MPSVLVIILVFHAFSVTLAQLPQLSQDGTLIGFVDNNGIENGNRSSGRMYAMCPPQFQLIGNKCYLLLNQNSSWLEAHFYCKDKNAHLAEPQQHADRKLRNFLIKYDKEFELNDSIWIGATRNLINQYWQWRSDGKQLTYDAFSEFGETCTGQCCAVYNPSLNYKWSASDCSDKHHFICQHKMFKVREENRYKVYKRWNDTYPNQLAHEVLLEDVRSRNHDNRSQTTLTTTPRPTHYLTITDVDVSNDIYYYKELTTLPPQLINTSTTETRSVGLTEEDLKLQRDREKERQRQNGKTRVLVEQQNRHNEEEEKIQLEEEQRHRRQKEEEERQRKEKEYRRKQEEERVQQEISILNEILNHTSELIAKRKHQHEEIKDLELTEENVKPEATKRQIEDYVEEMKKKIDQLVLIYIKDRDPVTESISTSTYEVTKHKKDYRKEEEHQEANANGEGDLKDVIVELEFKKKQIEYKKYMMNHLLLKKAELAEEAKREKERREEEERHQQQLREQLQGEFAEFERLERKRQQEEENRRRLLKEEFEAALKRLQQKEEERNEQNRREDAERRDRNEMKRVLVEIELKKKHIEYEKYVMNYLRLKQAELTKEEKNEKEAEGEGRNKEKIPEEANELLVRDELKLLNEEEEERKQQVKEKNECEEAECYVKLAELPEQVIQEPKKQIVEPEVQKVQIDYMEEINNVFTYVTNIDPVTKPDHSTYEEEHQQKEEEHNEPTVCEMSAGN